MLNHVVSASGGVSCADAILCQQTIDDRQARAVARAKQRGQAGGDRHKNNEHAKNSTSRPTH